MLDHILSAMPKLGFVEDACFADAERISVWSRGQNASYVWCIIDPDTDA